MRKAILLLLLFFASSVFAEDKVLNIYVWANYIPQSVLERFQKETGIRVQETDYDNNEILYAKLKADPNIGYDMIIPSSYFVTQMMQEHMLRAIDLSQISNFKELKPRLVNLAFDPGNHYSVPFTWGSTGILVNKKYWDPNSIQKWSDLWQPRFQNQLLMLNDMREAFSMAFLKLGLPINNLDPRQIEQAYYTLKNLAPNIKVYNSDSLISIYGDEDVTIGMSWSGEAFKVVSANPDYVFVYPKDGFSIWIDCMAIPKNAPHYQNALRFINFLLRPDVSLEVMSSNGYATPNEITMKMAPPRFRDSPIINPSEEILKRSQIQSYIGAANTTYQKYWQLIKLG